MHAFLPVQSILCSRVQLNLRSQATSHATVERLLFGGLLGVSSARLIGRTAPADICLSAANDGRPNL